MNSKNYLLIIRIILIFFILATALSGLTAFPLETELRIITACCFDESTTLGRWLLWCYAGVKENSEKYPFISYGTDWLGFAHLVIATAFIGPIINPIKNIWIIQWGMIACGGVIILAALAGPVRGIPFYWTLIDCSFGVFGIIPLLICYRLTQKLEKLNEQN
ncbi:MAG: hypothetical protein HYY40_10385 [Bacteroidetes bacterium]|nr:hypothetical protein [Bacteroidota bacterium]